LNRIWSLRSTRRTELNVLTQFENLKTIVRFVSWALNSNIDSYNKLELNVRANKNSCSIQFDEQVCLFDLIRRTRTRTRLIRSNKISSSFNSLGQKECTQPCSNLGFDARARVQLNPTATLFKPEKFVCDGLDFFEFELFNPIIEMTTLLNPRVEFELLYETQFYDQTRKMNLLSVCESWSRWRVWT
jgi:hypothetical protein